MSYVCRVLIALLVATSSLDVALAQDKAAAPWPPQIARKLPPPGKPVDEKILAELRRRHDAIKAGRKDLDPDVEIFLKAVDFALRHGEFFDPKKDPANAIKLLDLAEERLAAREKKESPWAAAHGNVVRGYLSVLDGSAQPYGLVIPEKLDRTKPAPLYVWLHGRGDTRCDLQFIASFLGDRPVGPLLPENAIVLHPFGRYCNGWKSAGELDVAEAIYNVRNKYEIDEDRIVLAGFSMGGAGAWHMGAHHAHAWCAVHAGAGFVDVKRYQNITPDKMPPWYEQKLWGLYDVPDYRRNFLNVPVLAYSGEEDKQKAAADIMEAELAAEGLKLPHLIGPKMGHKYHPDALVEIHKRLAELVERGRNPLPQKVSLQTKTVRYGHMFWIEARRLDRHWEDSRLDAEVTSPTSITVTTKNVRDFMLRGPPWPDRQELQQFKATDEVVIDGKAYAVGPAKSFVGFERSEDGWQPYYEFRPGGLHKTPRLQGPIDDAFMGPFTIVLPDEIADPSPVDRYLAFEAQHFIDRWRMLMRGEPRVRTASQVDKIDRDENLMNLILWGTPKSNPMIARALSNSPLTWTDEVVGMGNLKFDPKQVVPVMIQPRSDFAQSYFVINSGLTFREAHDRTNSLQNPKLGDWAFIDISEPPTDEAPGKVLVSGFFDEEWKYVPQPAREPRTSAKTHKLQTWWTARLAGTNSYGLAWGVSGDRLAYVVFNGPKALGVDSPVESSSSRPSGSSESIENIVLRRPDGTTTKLPDHVQLRQIIDGRYEEGVGKVTLEDFEAFKDSTPEAYTIEALLKFAEARSNRAKQTPATK